MPHAGQRGAPDRGARDAGDPELGAARPDERRREPAFAGREVDRAGHVLERLLGRSHPVVEPATATREVGGEQRELALHPAGRHRRDDPSP